MATKKKCITDKAFELLEGPMEFSSRSSSRNFMRRFRTTRTEQLPVRSGTWMRGSQNESISRPRSISSIKFREEATAQQQQPAQPVVSPVARHPVK